MLRFIPGFPIEESNESQSTTENTVGGQSVDRTICAPWRLMSYGRRLLIWSPCDGGAKGEQLETTKHSVRWAGRGKLGAKAEHGTVVPGMPFPWGIVWVLFYHLSGAPRHTNEGPFHSEKSLDLIVHEDSMSSFVLPPKFSIPTVAIAHSLSCHNYTKG